MGADVARLGGGGAGREGAAVGVGTVLDRANCRGANAANLADVKMADSGGLPMSDEMNLVLMDVGRALDARVRTMGLTIGAGST